MSEDDQGSNTGYSFLATVIASGILGFIIDSVANTAPWGLLSFMVIGFVYATYKAQKAMQAPAENTETKKDDKKS